MDRMGREALGFSLFFAFKERKSRPRPTLSLFIELSERLQSIQEGMVTGYAVFELLRFIHRDDADTRTEPVKFKPDHLIKSSPETK